MIVINFSVHIFYTFFLKITNCKDLPIYNFSFKVGKFFYNHQIGSL